MVFGHGNDYLRTRNPKTRSCKGMSEMTTPYHVPVASLRIRVPVDPMPTVQGVSCWRPERASILFRQIDCLFLATCSTFSMTESGSPRGRLNVFVRIVPRAGLRCKPPVNFQPRLDYWMISYWSLLTSKAPQLTGHAPTFVVRVSLSGESCASEVATLPSGFET
jgi:hypothetical protein